MYYLDRELPTSTTLLSLQFQHPLVFGTPLDNFVLPNPLQANLALRYTWSAQILFSIKKYVFIQKGIMFIPSWVNIIFIIFFKSREISQGS